MLRERLSTGSAVTPEVSPVLVLAWGNPSRGDDAIGPAFAQTVEAWCLPGVEVLTDFQLQIEHSLDLLGRRCVLFVDACVGADAFNLEPLQAAIDHSHTSHALSPQAVLQVFAQTQGQPPPSWLLKIPGQQWDLGEPMSEPAIQALQSALRFIRPWLTCKAQQNPAICVQDPT